MSNKVGGYSPPLVVQVKPLGSGNAAPVSVQDSTPSVNRAIGPDGLGVVSPPSTSFNGFQPTYVGSGRNRDQYLPDSATDLVAETAAKEEESKVKAKEERVGTDAEGRRVLASTQVNLSAPFDGKPVESVRPIS